MILGDGTRIPVRSLAGEYLEHLRKANERCFANSSEHLFEGKPRRNSQYVLDFADKIGTQWLSAKWQTTAYDPDSPQSDKHLNFLAPSWTLSEYIRSGSIYNHEHIITLRLHGRKLPDSMADTLIGRPLSEVIDLPDPFIWTRKLPIKAIRTNDPGTETSITLAINEIRQESLIRTLPDPAMEKAGDELIAQVQRLIRKCMKDARIDKAGLAKLSDVPEDVIAEALAKGSEGPSLRLIARLLHAMKMSPRIELKEDIRRSNRR